MALSASTVWELRSAGSDSSGGGFVAGASGTDRSQSDTAFVSGTNLTVDSSTNTDVAPDGHTPVANDVGNLIQITTTGTGAAFTTGFYQILSIQSGKWRLDRSPAATSSAGATWAMGGALATFSKLASAMLPSNKTFAKGTGFTSTSTTTFSQSSADPTNSTMHTRIIGYGTTRGDGVQAKLTLSTNTSLTGLIFSNNGWRVENIHVDCNSLGSSVGIRMNGLYSSSYNCKVSNFRTRGFETGGSNAIDFDFCEVTGGSGAGATAGFRLDASGSTVTRCYVHDNACIGINPNTSNCLIEHNLVTNNTGSTSDGIQCSNRVVRLINNTVYGSGRDNIRLGAWSSQAVVRNNILTNAGVSATGYGLNYSIGAGAPAGPWYDGNAYYSNGGGNRNNIDDTSTNAINGVVAYTNTLDIVCSASPFTNAGSGDFSLNNTAGGGAAIRGHGIPGAIPGIATVGYPDMGVFQHQEVVGGASAPNLDGGISQ